MSEVAASHPPLETLLRDVKPNSGHLLKALHLVKEAYGYIPPESVPVVARKLGLTPAAVFGCISFYSELPTTPPPKVEVSWCSGPACRLSGGDEIRRIFEAVLGVPMEGATPDGRVGLHVAQCDGSCCAAPMVWINGRVHGPLTLADAVRIARGLRDGTFEVREEWGHGELR